MRPSRAATATCLAAAVMLLTSCASATPVESAPPSDAPALSGRLTVSAAASLKSAFDELAVRFVDEHPGVTIAPISYDGSSTLATQIIEGARVDVFASADEKNMQKVVDAGLAVEPQLFATNTLTLVTPAGNPAGVTGLANLADPALTVVLCAAEVPCGAASATLLADAQITASVDSYEQNVTAVLTKVASGDADVGLVYVTDAAATGDVDAIPTEGAAEVVNRYPIVALTDAPDAELADAFVSFVLAETGREVLSARKFGLP